MSRRAVSDRVNLLILSSGLGLGGAETVIRHLAQSIDPLRFNVTIGCIKALGVVGAELAGAGTDIVCLADPNQQGVDYLTALKLRKLIRARRIQVVHTHTTDGLVDAAVCKLVMPGLKVIHTFHFGNYPHIGKRLLWMERISSRLADRLIAVGEVQRRQIMSVFGLRPNRIGMIWNGVAPTTGVTDGSFRARIGAGNRLIVGTIATLIEQKGLRDLLAVAAELRDRAAEVCFVIVGDGHLRPELEAIRHDLGLDDMVILAGWVPGAASVALPDFDVFFQPSLWEAMSVAVLEAMAARKPIVATRVGENTEILEDGVDGLLVESRDVPGMAAALRRLIDSPELRRRLGEAGAAKVAHGFGVADMARAYEQLYLETLR